MHLLTTTSISLDEIVEAVDLAQPPGDIAVLSFADSDLAGLAAAWEAEHDHDDFDTFVVTLGEIAEPSELAARVAGLAENFDVLRVKGFAAVADKPLRLLVQAVGPRVTHQYDRPWAAAETRQGRLVVIGLKGLDRAAVTRALVG